MAAVSVGIQVSGMTLAKCLWYVAIAAALLAATQIFMMAYLEYPTSYWAALWPVIALGWQLRAGKP